MKKLTFIPLMLLLGTGVFVQAEPLVGFSSNHIKVAVGETFTLDITMKGFPTTEGGGINLRYNPYVLQVAGVTVDGTWTFVNRDGEINNATGTIASILFSSYNGLSDNATIATVEFEAINKGRSRLDLDTSALNPFASDGAEISVNYQPAVIRVRDDSSRRSR
jgi:hypothetical protein